MLVVRECSRLPCVQVALLWTPSSSPSPQAPRHFEIERKIINLLLLSVISSFRMNKSGVGHSPVDTPLPGPPVNSATYAHTDTHSNATPRLEYTN